MKIFFRGLFIFGILSINIGCDQFSKRMVREHVGYSSEINIMSHYVTLTRVENAGAFLSLGNQLPPVLRLVLLSVIPTLVLLAVFLFLITRHNLPKLSRIGICFLLGGGIGNIYDRIVYGTVTDFLHIDFVFFQTGIFNMADVSIMTGALIIMVASYLNNRNKSVTNPA